MQNRRTHSSIVQNLSKMATGGLLQGVRVAFVNTPPEYREDVANAVWAHHPNRDIVVCFHIAPRPATESRAKVSAYVYYSVHSKVTLPAKIYNMFTGVDNTFFRPIAISHLASILMEEF